MAYEHCPITAQLVLELTKRLSSSSLYDDLVEEAEEVQGLAENSHPDDHELALRAFYLLEVMYHVLIPKVVVPRLEEASGVSPLKRTKRAPTTLDALADAHSIVEQVQNWRFPRSREGITSLIEQVQELSDDTEVEDYALALDGSVTPELRNLRHTQVLPMHSILGHVMAFARELRKALNPDSEVGWTLFASLFGSAWNTANQDESELLKHAARLTRINNRTVLYPWNPMTSYRD